MRREDHRKERAIGLFLLYSLVLVLLAFGSGYAINTHKWKPIHDNLRQKIEQNEKAKNISSQKEEVIIARLQINEAPVKIPTRRKSDLTARKI